MLSKIKVDPRVMGFDPVATHDHGEPHCASRRITMILDLKTAYHRLRLRKRWIYRTLTAGWDEGLHRRFAVESEPCATVGSG